jgi:hypothetical protein
MTIKLGLVAVSLTGILTACGADGRHSFPCPTCPTPTYTLSGVITGMTPAGPVPLAGALVQESRTSSNVTTNADGFYSMTLSPVPPDNSVVATKIGYSSRTSTVTISGDTRVDIQLDPQPPLGPRATYTVSGVISEITQTGLVPIEGVLVEGWSYVDNHTYSDTLSATTDRNGFYSMPGVWGGTDVYNGIWLTKAGYRIDPQMNPSCDGCFRSITVTGDMRLDLQLERLPSAAPLLGPVPGRLHVFPSPQRFLGRGKL